MNITRWASVLGLAALTACANPQNDKRIDELEARIAKLEQGAPAAAKGGNTASADDKVARELYKKANKAMQEGNREEAVKLFTEMKEKFTGTRYAQTATRFLTELQVVGTKVDTLNVEKWLQGESSLTDGKATLVVFWEVWCPHCKREVPKLQAVYNEYNPQGLNVIGLTKMSRNKTEADVQAFIDETGVGYPIAKEDGKASKTFAVSGVPAAAVVKDGEIIWRGHPGTITPEQLQEWVKG